MREPVLPDDLGIHTRVRHLEVLYRLGASVVGARELQTVYAAALDAVIEGLGADRASLLLFDPDGVLRFKAARGLSSEYMAAVEGHTPWTPDTPDPQPMLVPDVRKDADLGPYHDVFHREGIRSLAFVPLRHEGRVVGKFMAYFDSPHAYSLDEVRLGEMIANHLAIAISKQVAEDAREDLHADREAERAQLAALLRHIPMGVVILDAHARTPLLHNEPAEELWARSETVLRGDDSPLTRMLEQGEVLLDAEVPISKADGTHGFVAVSGSPIRDEDGDISSAVVVLEDISKRKRGELALRFLANASVTLAESLDFEQTLRRVAELMVPEFADWCDFDFVHEDGTIQLVSVVHSDPSKIELAKQLRMKYPVTLDSDAGIGGVVRSKKPMFIPRVTDELLRTSAQSDEHYQDILLLGLRSAIVVPLMARERVLGTLTLVMAESGRHYDESDLPFVEEVAQSCALAIDNARLYADARRELEERQRAEAALKDSEERYRMLSEVTSDYIFSYKRAPDGQFELEWISDAFERITGYSREEIMDRERWSRAVPPEDLPMVMAFSANMSRGERQVLEHRIIKKSGGTSWLRIYGRPIIDDSSGVVTRILGAGQDITARKEAEKALHDLAESLERRVAERTRALASANERLRNEVQERSRAEEQLGKANAALRTSNRELQDFAYVASHDLQEPLRKIQSFADLLQTDYGSRLDDQGRFYIQRMQTAAERMTDLIRGLLNYSRVRTQGHPFEMVDLKDVVREVLSDLEITISENRGAVSVGSMPTIEADPTQMRQLFQNLIGNALKFRAADRAPIVRINCTHMEDVCTIEITDNGIGFGTQYAERIFAPFQRLHGRAAYPGTGMGLAICRRIVERHSGTITAQGTPGEGATFVISLPVRQDEWSAHLRGLSVAS